MSPDAIDLKQQRTQQMAEFLSGLVRFRNAAQVARRYDGQQAEDRAEEERNGKEGGRLLALPRASQAVIPQSASHQIAAPKTSDEEKFDQKDPQCDIVGSRLLTTGRSARKRRHTLRKRTLADRTGGSTGFSATKRDVP